MAAEKNMKILVVDDHASMRKIVRALLKYAGFMNVEEADDGGSALRTLESEPFDFVITDWNMPNMSGLELLKKIRESPEFKHIPVLMVTAEALQQNIVAAARAGVSNYIIKPFNTTTLGEKIEEIFN